MPRPSAGTASGGQYPAQPSSQGSHGHEAECRQVRLLANALNDIGITVHAHPTLSEAVKEAALGALGRAIHI